MNKAPKEEPATLLLALLLLMKSVIRVLALSFFAIARKLDISKIILSWSYDSLPLAVRSDHPKTYTSTLHPNRLQHVCKPQISIPHCHFIVIGDLFTSCLDSKFRTLSPETATLNSGSGKATRRNINSLINRVPNISRRGSRVAPGQPTQLDSRQVDVNTHVMDLVNDFLCGFTGLANLSIKSRAGLDTYMFKT